MIIELVVIFDKTTKPPFPVADGRSHEVDCQFLSTNGDTDFRESKSDENANFSITIVVPSSLESKSLQKK